MKRKTSRRIRICMALFLSLAVILQTGLLPPVFAESVSDETELFNTAVPGDADSSSIDSGDTDSNPGNKTTSVSGDSVSGDAAGNSDSSQNTPAESEVSAEENHSGEDSGQTTEPAEESSGYPDTQDHWAKDIIDYWTEKKAVSGYPNGNFLPDHTLSRAEAAVLIANIRNLKGDTEPFYSDVPADNWAFGQIQACSTFDILKGTGHDLFQPGHSITREAAMTLIYRAADLSPAETDSILQKAQDRKELSDWAEEAAAGLLQEGIIQGDQKGLIHPGDPVTRAEFLTMLYRIENKELWDPTLQPSFALINLQCLVSSREPGGKDNPVRVPLTASNTGERILILPAFADLQNIELEFTLPDPSGTAALISGVRTLISNRTFDITEISWPDSEGAYPLNISITDGEKQRDYHYRVFFGASLDSMFLTSEEGSGGRFYTDAEKGNSVDASMRMIGSDGSVYYDGDLKQLKSRGNSTFEYLKKPYQIKLDQKADLIGNGEKGKTWVLLANYADPTMMKDKLIKDMAADFQLPGTPDSKWVDLYFDGEYRGVYLLSEKIQISSIGLDITDLEGMYEEVNENYGDSADSAVSKNKYGNQIQYVKDLTDPDDIRNGYLIELNNSQYDEISGFITKQGVGVNIKAPEYVSKEAALLISEYYQEFENAVYAVNQRGRYTGVNPKTKRSFTEYCDLDSMARMYLLFEFSLNADAYFGSTYFYMENNILHQGPVWDGDLSFGTVWDEQFGPTHALQNTYLTEALINLPVFRKAVKELYDHEFREMEVTCANETLNRYKEILAGSERLNHIIWPEYYKIAAFDVAYPKGSSYGDIISETQTWMTDRIEYLDQKFKNWYL